MKPKNRLTHYLTSLALALSLLVAGSIASARTVDGHSVPDTLQVNGTQLTLNGAGIRKKVIFDVYLAALYTERQTEQAQTILNSSATRAMRLVLLRDIDGKTLAGALNDGLRDNTNDGQWQAIQSSANAFSDLLLKQKSLKRGSVVDIVFQGPRVSVSAMGAQQGAVSDATFARALLAVWIGNKPAQSSLKQELLGRD